MRLLDKKYVYVLAPDKVVDHGQTTVVGWTMVLKYHLVVVSAGSQEDIALYGERIKEYIKIAASPSDGLIEIREGDGICIDGVKDEPEYIVESISSGRGFSTFTAKRV